MQNIFCKIYGHTLDEPLLWFCALAGTGLFFIQFILSFLGADPHSEIEDGGLEIEAGKFKWLSKQALTGFLLMFGWVGLTCRKEFACSLTISLFIACAAGIVAMFLIGWIFKMAKKLKSSGTVFKIEEAIGKEAMVYQRIPQGGMGKITLSLHNFTHEIDAISHAQEDLPSFILVRIIQIANDNTVVVVPKK